MLSINRIELGEDLLKLPIYFYKFELLVCNDVLRGARRCQQSFMIFSQLRLLFFTRDLRRLLQIFDHFLFQSQVLERMPLQVSFCKVVGVSYLILPIENFAFFELLIFVQLFAFGYKVLLKNFPAVYFCTAICVILVKSF